MNARFVPSMNHRLLSLSLCAALVLALAPAARAEKADRNKPMNIEADALRHDELQQTTVFTGHVVMTKGSIVLRGARLEVHQDPDGYQSGIVTAEAGKRAFFRQKRDTAPGAPDEFVEGEAERIEYDERSELVRLYSNAVVRELEGARMTNQITGPFISYDNRKEVATVRNDESGKSVAGGGRGTLILAPKRAPAGGAQ